MNISQRNQDKIYAAIHEPIMEKRMAVLRAKETIGGENALTLDRHLGQLEHQIWVKVHSVLKIKGPA